MYHAKAKELRAERKRLCEQAAQVLDNKTLSAEERSRQFDTMMADADRMKAEIDRWEKVDALEVETRGSAAPPNGRPGQPGGSDDPEVAKEREKRYQQAWARCMKYGFRSKLELGIRGVSPEDQQLLAEHRAQFELPQEYRDMLTQGGQAFPGGAGAAGGFFVPTGFVPKVDEAMKYYGPMLAGNGSGTDGLPVIMTTVTGQPLPYPTSNDTAVTGERISENQPATGNDVSLGMIMLNAWMYSTKFVKVSIALLQDSAFDVEQFLADNFGQRLGRVLNQDMTVGQGVGSSAPNGIITAATQGVIFAGAGTNDGASLANTIGSDDLTNLEHSVDPVYRRGASYMMHDTTLAAIKRAKDKYGRPLWLPGISVSAPDTINGYRYQINQDMDQLQSQAASPVVAKKTVLYGQIQKYLARKVRELGILRLDERFAEFGQVAFLGFARYDGNLLDAGTHPVKYGVSQF